MMEEKKKKPKRYRKNTLRKTLERKMQKYLKDPKIKVSAMEFTRWLKFYVEKFNLDEELCKSKTLEEPVVDAFGQWLGYPLR